VQLSFALSYARNITRTQYAVFALACYPRRRTATMYQRNRVSPFSHIGKAWRHRSECDLVATSAGCSAADIARNIFAAIGRTSIGLAHRRGARRGRKLRLPLLIGRRNIWRANASVSGGGETSCRWIIGAFSIVLQLYRIACLLRAAAARSIALNASSREK